MSGFNPQLPREFRDWSEGANPQERTASRCCNNARGGPVHTAFPFCYDQRLIGGEAPPPSGV